MSSSSIFYFFMKSVNILPSDKFFWVDQGSNFVVTQDGDNVIVT